METTTFTQSNYKEYYNAIQLSLPLNVDVFIDENDEVVSFQKALEGVNLYKYLKKKLRRGRKGYDKVMLLRIILFGRMIGKSSLDDLESACRYDVRFMYLAEHNTPSFMAFERLMKDYLIKDIEEIFYEVSQKIGELMNINQNIQYIDGTKIEANANKYTFVYRKRIINARKKLYAKITDSIIGLNMERGFDFSYQYHYCAQEIGYIVQYLMEIMQRENIEPVYGKGKRKDRIQRWYDEFMGYYTKLMEYEYWLDIIGEKRSSCSKTDYDATMCATKIDYYCNTGLSRPCYNAQIGVSDGIIVNADLYQNAGDTLTFIPFIEKYHSHTGKYPEYPMADAGYGSYDNYMYCAAHDMELVAKYNMYAKKHDPQFMKKKYNAANWKEDENGNKKCPNGYIFDQYMGERYDESGRYLKIKRIYGKKEKCEGCPYKKECCQKNQKERTVSRDEILKQFYEEVDRNLSTEMGKELKKQRSIQVEGAFGVIKQDMKFTRFTRRGMKNARMEFLIVCLGYNLKKYHKYRIRQNKEKMKETIN